MTEIKGSKNMKGTIKSTSAEELTDKQAESGERTRKIERWFKRASLHKSKSVKVGEKT